MAKPRSIQGDSLRPSHRLPTAAEATWWPAKGCTAVSPKTYPDDAATYQRLFRQLPQVAIFDDHIGPVIRIFKVTAT